MKTLNNIAGIIKSTLVIAALFMSTTLNAQVSSSKHKDSKLQVTLNNHFNYSGNGFGLRHCPALGLKMNRAEFSAGPVLKLTEKRITGIHSKLVFTLMDSKCSFSGRTYLYGYMSFEKNFSQNFGKSWNELEQFITRDSELATFDYRQIRFKGVDFSTGFAVGHQFNERLSLCSELGVSIYHVKRLSHQNMDLYFFDKGFVLQVGLGVRYTFK